MKTVTKYKIAFVIEIEVLAESLEDAREIAQVIYMDGVNKTPKWELRGTEKPSEEELFGWGYDSGYEEV